MNALDLFSLRDFQSWSAQTDSSVKVAVQYTFMH